MFESLKRAIRLTESSFNSPFLSKETVTTTLDKDENVEMDLSQNSNEAFGLFDDGSGLDLMYGGRSQDIVTKQASLIEQYRRISAYPEVADAIDEIVNEMSFVTDNDNCCFLGFRDNVLTDNLKDLLQSIFDEAVNLLQLNTNIDVLCKRFYVDGQLVIGLSYDKKTNEIKKAMIMSPVGLVYNKDTKTWAYDMENEKTIISSSYIKNAYMDEEIVRIDSGLYNRGLILSHLNNVIKIVNQLQTLEDLLIPLRFSRSVSRRVFNIDVGNLPYNKAVAAVEDIKNKIRYRKFYDPETGTISNNNSITSIVEDLYFPSRDGRKGTSVDILEETGNLGETGDLDYFKSKLYNALKVPTARLMGDNKTVFDFSSTSIETSEIKFFAFINRLRQRFNPLILEVMKRVAVSSKTLTEEEFINYSQYIFVGWEKESNFLERQRIDILKQRLELYAQFKEYEGDIYSKKYLLTNVLKMSEEEIEQMRQEIIEEGSQPTEESEMGEDEIEDMADNIENQEESADEPTEEPDEDIDVEELSPKTVKKATKLVQNKQQKQVKKAIKLTRNEE